MCSYKHNPVDKTGACSFRDINTHIGGDCVRGCVRMFVPAASYQAIMQGWHVAAGNASLYVLGYFAGGCLCRLGKYAK